MGGRGGEGAELWHDLGEVRWLGGRRSFGGFRGWVRGRYLEFGISICSLDYRRKPDMEGNRGSPVLKTLLIVLEVGG